jgi:predicted transcriptional regulator of viral defense system
MEHSPNTTRQQQLIRLASEVKTLRARELDRHGIARSYLHDLVARGVLVQTGRGLYTLADTEVSEYQTLIEASLRLPRGMICLASALRFHGLTTQNPWKVWMLIKTGTRIPKVDYPALFVFQASGPSFAEGVESHLLDGTRVRITSVAKTVADCFKYRNKIGLDVALEALRECLRERRTTREELHHFARICRVDQVMKPYIEAFSISL